MLVAYHFNVKQRLPEAVSLPFTITNQSPWQPGSLAAILFVLMIPNYHQHKLDDTDHKTLSDALETSLRTMYY